MNELRGIFQKTNNQPGEGIKEKPEVINPDKFLPYIDEEKRIEYEICNDKLKQLEKSFNIANETEKEFLREKIETIEQKIKKLEKELKDFEKLQSFINLKTKNQNSEAN